MDTGSRPSATPPLTPIAIMTRIILIGAGMGGAAAAFGWAGGWIGPQRLTADRIVAALSNRGGDPAGHRRNHSKGVCFNARFVSNGAGAAYSTASMLKKGDYPVTGRFAIAVGNPKAPDIMGRVESMAVRIVAPDGAEWRSAMNDSPVFVVSTPADFYALTRAQEIDPATGKPSPEAASRFFASHPKAAAFAHWAATAPWTGSWANVTYNSLDAFRFSDSHGAIHTIRWSMEPTAAPTALPRSALAEKGPDFLAADLSDRLSRGPLTWRLTLTVAAPGDPSNDATVAWPSDRKHIDIGTLVVTQAIAEENGPCRDYNYDPTILPPGMRVSDDPLLAARSAAYARSFDLRSAELGRAHKPESGKPDTGKPETGRPDAVRSSAGVRP